MTQRDPSAIRLNVSGFETVVSLTRDAIDGPIQDLFRFLGDVVRDLPADRRAVVALAGVPGSGKTTLAALLAYLSVRIERPLPVAAVSMDGWHWPNEQLDAMPATMPDGEPVSMRQRKGSVGSFDVEAIARAIDALRDAHRPACLPAYDRQLHEPVAGRAIVAPGVRVVLLEGNYLLLKEGPWQAVAERLDAGLFLDLDPVWCREAVVQRHIAGGASRAEAIRKYEINDGPNTQTVLASRDAADAILYCDPEHRLTRVEVVRPRKPWSNASATFPSVSHRDPLA